MPDNQITETEIMKALECCCDGKITRCIKECPLKDFDGECYSAMKRDILALINRKNAEIEEKTKRLREVLPIVQEIRTEARAEAIKEFAERVKEYKYQSADWSHGEHPFVVEVDDIDQIAKEIGVEL